MRTTSRLMLITALALMLMRVEANRLNRERSPRGQRKVTPEEPSPSHIPSTSIGSFFEDDGSTPYRKKRHLSKSCSEKKSTCAPTASPTTSPTPRPTPRPTPTPTRNPTPAPTRNPTPVPTDHPTTATPTYSPTESMQPTSSMSPTATPSMSPTSVPSSRPSAPPSLMPTMSAIPSQEPSASPSGTPTGSPSISSSPSAAPSSSPSISPAPTPYPRGTVEEDVYDEEGNSDSRKIGQVATCAAPIPDDATDFIYQLVTYDYTLNTDFGFNVTDVISQVELALHDDLKQQYLACFPWQEEMEFVVHLLNSAPVDTVLQQECTVSERTGSGDCIKLRGEYMTTIFYLAETSRRKLAPQRRLQADDSIGDDGDVIEEEITDPNVLDAFQASLSGFFDPDVGGINRVDGVTSSSFSSITNDAIPPTQSQDRNLPAIAGGTVGGAFGLGLIVLLGLFGANAYRSRKRDAEENVFDETYDLEEIPTAGPEARSLASFDGTRAYVVNDIMDSSIIMSDGKDTNTDIISVNELRDENWTATEFIATDAKKQKGLLGGMIEPSDVLKPEPLPPKIRSREYEVNNTVDL